MSIQILKNKTSAIFLALILFCFNKRLYASLPLTETIYTIPDGELSVKLEEKIINTGSTYFKETASLGIGILSDLSVWYSLDYMHSRKYGNTFGDSFIKIWYYIGDYKAAHTGLLIDFRIPTGPDAYQNTEWRNISFGNNEIKIGPVSKIDITKSVFMHINLFYIFRQGQGEGFYGGFHLNPLKKSAYTNIFGLNYKSKDAFLYKDNLKNDYAAFSMAFNTDKIYPVIPFIEFYTSHRVYKQQSDKSSRISIEGAEINPVLFSAGARYFFSDNLYAGLYYVFNPVKEKNYIKDIFGFDFSLQF